jgi:hypothetical protein
MLSAQSLPSRFIPNERTYEHCKNVYEDKIQKVRNKCEARVKLGHETWLCSDPQTGSFYIQYHQTPIVIYREDGSVSLDSGGWKTRSTKTRMNDFSPFSVYSNEHGIWKIKVDEKEYGFADDIVVHADKVVEGFNETSDREITFLKKKIKRYIKDFCKAIIEGRVESPSKHGNCFSCLGVFGKDTWHLDQHMKEHYYVPALLNNAIKEFPREMCPITSDFFYRIWVEDKPISEISDWQKDLVVRDCKKMLRKFLYREYGLSC